jgi:osmotically-inducible protein OsmY
MNKIVLSVFGLLLPLMLISAQVFTASGNQSASAKEGVTKTKKETAPKSDDEILKCITDKLSNSEKLKTQGLSASVSDGEATLTGQAQNAGSKGAATRIAQSCGAKSVKNNITAPPIPRPKKSEEKKSEPLMKN